MIRDASQRLDQLMAGLSESKVAEAAAIHRKTLQRWREKVGITGSVVQLADVLGVTLDWLLAGRQPQWQPGRGPQQLQQYLLEDPDA